MALTPSKDAFKPSLILGVFCILGAFITSLFFDGYRDIIYAPANMLLLTGCCLIMIPAFARGFYLPSALTAFLIFAFWLYITVSLAWSTIPFTSLVTYIIFISGPLLFFTFVLPDGAESGLKILTRLFILTISMLAIWALFQYLFLHNIYGSRAHHPFPNPNILAALLNLGLLPLWAFALSSPDKGLQRPIALALTILVFAALLATQSRAALLAFIIGALLTSFVLRQNIKASPKSFILLLVACAGIYGLMYNGATSQITERLIDLTSPATDPTIIPRIALWHSAWAMFKDNWLLGTGLGTFYMYYGAYRTPADIDSTGSWAHMDPLQLGLETGFIVPLIFYALLVAILLRTIKALKATEPDSPLRPTIIGLFAGLLTIGIHSHASFPLYIMPILMVCGTWLAAWHHATAQALGKDIGTRIEPEGIQRPILTTSVLAIASLIALMSFSSAWGQHYLLKAIDDIKRGDIDGFSKHIERAEKFAPASFIDPEVQLAGLYTDILAPVEILLSPEEKTQILEDGMDLLNNAQSMNPAWAEIDYKRGKLLVTADAANISEAIVYWEIALTKNPLHYKSRIELVQAYISKGYVSKAYDLLEEGLSFPHEASNIKEMRTALQNISELSTIQKAYKLRRQKGSSKTP